MLSSNMKRCQFSSHAWGSVKYKRKLDYQASLESRKAVNFSHEIHLDLSIPLSQPLAIHWVTNCYFCHAANYYKIFDARRSGIFRNFNKFTDAIRGRISLQNSRVWVAYKFFWSTWNNGLSHDRRLRTLIKDETIRVVTELLEKDHRRNCFFCRSKSSV